MFFRYSHLNRLRESRYLIEDEGDDQDQSAGDAGQQGTQGQQDDNIQATKEDKKLTITDRDKNKSYTYDWSDKVLNSNQQAAYILTDVEMHIVLKDLEGLSEKDVYEAYINAYLSAKDYDAQLTKQMANAIINNPSALLYYILEHGKCWKMPGKKFSDSWSEAALYSLSKKSGDDAYDTTQNTFLEFLVKISSGEESNTVLAAKGNQNTFNTLADMCLDGTINVASDHLMDLFSHARLYRCNDCAAVWEAIASLFGHRADWNFSEKAIKEASEGKLNKDILDCADDISIIRFINGKKQTSDAKYNNSKVIDTENDKNTVDKVQKGVKKLVDDNIKGSIDAITNLKPEQFATLVKLAGLKEIEANHMDATVLGKLVTTYEKNKSRLG